MRYTQYPVLRISKFMDCIFCKIISGEVRSSKVYEDEHILAFMDIQPVREGQTLVIPKRHIDHFSDIPDELATKVFLQSHRIAGSIRNHFQCERVGLVVHGYGVAHAHMVVVPQYDKDDIAFGQTAKIENGQVIFTGRDLRMVPHDELDETARVIREGLSA